MVWVICCHFRTNQWLEVSIFNEYFYTLRTVCTSFFAFRIFSKSSVLRDFVCLFVFCVLVLQGVINLESLGKRGYRVPPSGTIQVVGVLMHP